jgi:DNA-directed RNA polymerase specialized sigma24 family protein
MISRARRAKTENSVLHEAHRAQAGTVSSARVWDETLFQALDLAVASEQDAATRDIVLAYYGHTRVTTQEISDRLGIPKGTVTVKLQRFRQRLHRKLLAQLAPEVAP